MKPAPFEPKVLSRIPTRIKTEDGKTVYCMTDEDNKNLTDDNCMGYIVHTLTWEPK